MNKKKTTAVQEIKVKVNEENPESLELIASSIIKVADAFIAVQNSRLEQRVIVLLLQDYTGLPQGTIKKVLDAAPKLKTYYLKKV